MWCVNQLTLERLSTVRIKGASGAMLKIFIYGYVNRIPFRRRLERECQRNVEMMWVTGRLAFDFRTIADFRRGNWPAFRNVCRRFIELCRGLNLLSSNIAIDAQPAHESFQKVSRQRSAVFRKLTGSHV